MWTLNTSIHSTVSKDSAGVKFFTMWGSSLDFLKITAFQVASQLIIIIWVDAEILNFSGTEFATSIDIVYVGWFVSPQSSFLLISNFCGLEKLGIWKKHLMPLKTPKGDGADGNARKLGLWLSIVVSSLSLFFEWLVRLCEFHWVLDSQAWHMVHEIMRSPQFQAGFFTSSQASPVAGNEAMVHDCLHWLASCGQRCPSLGGPYQVLKGGERSSHWRPRF